MAGKIGNKAKSASIEVGVEAGVYAGIGNIEAKLCTNSGS